MIRIRTLLRDEDAITLDSAKTAPAFANMRQYRTLLVLRFPGQPPLIVVNPGARPMPDITPVPTDQPLNLASVHHQQAEDGTPFISAAALAPTRDGNGRIEIITGRLMSDRTQTLTAIAIRSLSRPHCCALVAALSIWLVRRGLSPLRRLAAETDAIDVRRLSHRIQFSDARQSYNRWSPPSIRCSVVWKWAINSSARFPPIWRTTCARADWHLDRSDRGGAEPAA
ncbi:hypothetical protein LZ023_34670 (plasmid) [Pseudomonas silvicola]|nr:hypothetical protein LZ023_34670 [Pseudomonas silvicola]